MNYQQKIEDLFKNFSRIAFNEIQGKAVSRYMVDAPGARGTPNPNRGPGTLRRIGGRDVSLQFSLVNPNDPDNLYAVSVSPDEVRVTLGSKKPYAGIHERGFEGTVNVPSHTRRITQAFGREIDPKEIQVQSYVRDATMPARPYMDPAVNDAIPKLFDWLERNSRQLAEGLAEGLGD